MHEARAEEEKPLLLRVQWQLVGGHARLIKPGTLVQPGSRDSSSRAAGNRADRERTQQPASGRKPMYPRLYISFFYSLIPFSRVLGHLFLREVLFTKSARAFAAIACVDVCLISFWDLIGGTTLLDRFL